MNCNRETPLTQSVTLAAEALIEGKLVAFPTETVYGLGADATQDKAVAQVFAAKGRPAFNPLIVHVSSLEEAAALGEFNAEASELGQLFWPGPLTLVVPRRQGCPVSLLASAGLGSLAIRVPKHPVAQALLKAVRRPVVAPSANPSGRISPTTAAHVHAGLGDKVSVILDGGPSAIGLESTIIGFLDGRPSLLRPGGLAREEIERALGHKLVSGGDSKAPSAPGQLESHYAPKAHIRLDAKAAREGEAYLAFGEAPDARYNLSPSGDLLEAAANLFRLLHEIDATGVAAIAVAPIPRHGLGEAMNDRLSRAAAPRPAESE
ncbi:threonylcarbamoyl-AMP synthase [Nordella sp. HKS 07]|uniref:L-threonylcarbamoyladenylate synthase n=1 Tax=Nordella sp. HKS 07 TaxID=2712222 RepID=UPI0013E1498F|nr:L-threonylcarbamoyladenylate synthase [Nordella sp. HKS 07]QIG49524.1 threonylcarbamoyl-AMP synthase [Nordella sp. HKS 07]